jgi:septal ring-binding cell division protein DamX
VRRILLIVVLCLLAFPLWAGYGLSNVVTKEITPGNAPPAELPSQVPTQIPADAALPSAPEQIPAKNIAAEAPEFKKFTFYPYTIHISSWQDRKEAIRQYEKKYRTLGMVFITKIDLGQTGLWYRIDYGAFSTINEAVLKLKDLQARNMIIEKDSFIGTSAPYTIEIGVYSAKTDALALSQKIRKKGLFPYVLKEPGGFYRVLSGAYPDEKSADPAREDLRASGLQPKITKR